MLFWLMNLDFAAGESDAVTVVRKYFVQITHNMAKAIRHRRR